MFLLTLIGTIVAALLALCGCCSVVLFFVDAHPGTPLPECISSFVSALAPLVLALILQLLVELLKAVTALRGEEDEEEEPAPAPSPLADFRPVAPAEEQKPARPVYFPVRDTPQGPVAAEIPTPVRPAPEAGKEPLFFKLDN